MDVLVNSIDIRDLLPSSSAFDQTTPLSAPDLRLLIDRLELRSQDIKSRVHNYLLSNHHHFSRLFSSCADSVSRADSLSVQLSDLLHLFSDTSVDVNIRNTVDEIKDNVKDLRIKNELELVRVIVGLCEEFSCVKEMVKNGQFVLAANKIKELKVAVRVQDGDDCISQVQEPVVYDLLKQEWHRCFEQSQDVLLKFMKDAVLFEHNANRVCVKYVLSIDTIDGVELREVLEAMDVIGILDYGVAKVADMMIKHVVTPTINCSTPISFVKECDQDSTQVNLKMVPSDDAEIEILNGENMYARLIIVLEFIYKSICLKNGRWMRCFGRLTWPKISELIISNFLSQVVPDNASKLADFQKIINISSDFENSLKDMMFISGSDKKDNRLSNFAENVEVHFASRKKTEILAKARNILLDCNFTVPQVRETIPAKSYDRAMDLLFLSERCVVSEAASQLMKLVHQTLQDVCMSSSKVGLEFYQAARDALLLYEAIVPIKDVCMSSSKVLEFYQAARDALLLYEAIVPIKLERHLDGINQVAVLMHNDCLYLSQEILGLAFEYRSDFPTSIKECAMFVDLAPELQLMAEDILQRQIHLVCTNLKGAIDSADGFQNTHQMQQYESAKFGVDQVVFILEKVHIIWEPLLLPSTYKNSMCMVLESVLSRVTSDILLLDDIAADETLQLQRLIQFLLDSLSSLMASVFAINEEGNSQIPSLAKIRKLEELLDMPLKSITTAWQSGELISCGFTASEVEDFVRAIFTDSPLRKECLWKIKNTSF